MEMLRRPLFAALVCTGLAAATLSTQAAAAGAALGAILASSIAASENRYYSDGYYSDGYYPQSAYVAPPVYAAEQVYVAPAPAYYGPTIVYRSWPVYGYRHAYYGHRYWHNGWR